MKNIKLLILAAVTILVIQSCGPAEGDNTGSEYMPDMGHSVALEANTYNYYYHNTWDEASTITLAELVKNPALPVSGTVPRGYAGGEESMGVHMGDDAVTAIRIAPNGSAPYYYGDTEEERTPAMADIQANPFPITAEGLERGKELYEIFCGICHGAKADGLGYLFDTDANPNAKYPLAPANLINEEFSAASNGRYYHAIIYGKNAMGGYGDKMSYEERWQVIHYIRSLQAKEAGLAYNEDENTYNPVFGTPASMMSQMADHMEMDEGMHMEEEHGEEMSDGHGEAAPAEEHDESHEGNH